MNEITCSNCHHLNRPGARFCAMCGHTLDIAVSVAGEESPTQPSRASAGSEPPGEDSQTVPAPRSHEFRVGHQTDVGRRREINEDSLLVLDYLCANRSMRRPAGLYVVADGIGGHEGGEIASGLLVRSLARQAASEWLPRVIEPQENPLEAGGWLAGAIQKGNAELYEWAHEAGYEMGTTVVAALVLTDRAYIAHVGDSRAYRITGAAIEQLTIDHSLVESLVATNQISREEARNHPQANVIYRTVGDHPRVTVDVTEITLAPGDKLLLCSDGLSGMLSDETILAEVSAAASLETACENLIDAANRAGGDDNSTVILIELKSP